MRAEGTHLTIGSNSATEFKCQLACSDIFTSTVGLKFNAMAPTFFVWLEVEVGSLRSSRAMNFVSVDALLLHIDLKCVRRFFSSLQASASKGRKKTGS